MNCRALFLSACTSCQLQCFVRFISLCGCTIITMTLSNTPSHIDRGRGRQSQRGRSRRDGPSTAGVTASTTARLSHTDLLPCQRSVNAALRPVCSGKSDDCLSTSSLHESSRMEADGTLERRSKTDGQTGVDRSSDEHKTSRQRQYHHTDWTPDVAAVRWTATAASKSTYLQPHDSPGDVQGDASSTDGQTNVD